MPRMRPSGDAAWKEVRTYRMVQIVLKVLTSLTSRRSSVTAYDSRCPECPESPLCQDYPEMPGSQDFSFKVCAPGSPDFSDFPENGRFTPLGGDEVRTYLDLLIVQDVRTFKDFQEIPDIGRPAPPGLRTRPGDECA